jgi:hypothetical protein
MLQSIRQLLRPIGWTRTSNREGYLKGTYDVLAVWQYGPEEQVWSNVGIYTEYEVEEILKKVGVTEEVLEKILENERPEDSPRK